MDQLSTTESAQLASHEKTIRDGVEHFVSVGRALRSIRDERLYRAGYATFEDYLEDRWEMHRSRAYQLIEAASNVDDVTSCQSKDPAPNGVRQKPPILTGDGGTHRISSAAASVGISEKAARQLSAVPPAERASVLAEAVATAPKAGKGKPKVTAKHVQKVAASRVAPEEPAKASPPSGDPAVPFASESAAVDAVLDQLDSHLRQLSRLLDANKAEKKCRAPFAHFVPYLGGVGNIAAGVATIRENLPGAADAHKPGYLPRRSVKQRIEYAKGGK